jgi:hypothetical protein
VRSYGKASAIFANKKAKNHTQNVQNVEKVLLVSRANYLDLVLLNRFGQIQIFGFGIWL